MKTKLLLTISVLTGLTTGFMTGCATVDSSGAVKTPRDKLQAAATAAVSPHDKPGFVTEIDTRDERLWVFRENSDDLKAFREKGRPARHVLRPGAGPLGLTLKSTESATIIEYVATKPGFVVHVDERDERLWVFHEGSDDLKAFREKGRPARHVLRPGAGPFGLTLKATESATIIEYVATKPGFVVHVDERDERLWVFHEGSDDLKTFREKGRPARHVVRPGAGPLGLTLKSTEAEILDAYLKALL